MDKLINDLLAAFESARRAKQYGIMIPLDGLLRQILPDDGSKKTWGVRSKISYEYHMGKYQIAMENEGAARTEHLEDSQQLAERSAEEADKAGDPLGRLFAEMNIAGLILPELGKWEIALGNSGGVAAKAEDIANASTTSESDRARASRIVLNARLHQIQMTMRYRKDFTAQYDVRDWLNIVRNNPVYLENEDDFQTAVEAAEKFLQL